jgi:hypothetical protein
MYQDFPQPREYRNEYDVVLWYGPLSGEDTDRCTYKYIGENSAMNERKI